MSGHYPPDDPRLRGRYSGDGDQTGSWRQPDPRQRGGQHGNSGSSQHGVPGGQHPGVPRYVPGASSWPGDPRQSTRGRMPSAKAPPHAARPAGSPGTRTDPTLYEWDRLSPEQQQAVLATLGVRGARPKASRGRLLVAGVLLVLVVVVIAIAFVLWRGL
jgi:hypothetical protein